MVLNTANKAQVIAFRKAAWKVTKIAHELSVSLQTIDKVIADYEKYGRHERKEGTGRPRKLSERDERFLLRKVKKDRRAPLQEITQHFGLNVSTQTI